MDYSTVGKFLLAAGALLVLGGLVFLALGKAGIARIPGDIHVQGDRWSFSFPIVTCIVISVVLTVILNLLGKRG